MLVGCLTAVFTTVLLGWAQKFQRRSCESADNPTFVTCFDGVSIFGPLEAHIRSKLGFTFKPGSAASVDLQGNHSVFENRFNCGRKWQKISQSKQILTQKVVLVFESGDATML